MSEKVREFWFIKNNLGTAICFAEIPPSKSYKKYIDKQAYDRLAEINKVLSDALARITQPDGRVGIEDSELFEQYFTNVDPQPMGTHKQIFRMGHAQGMNHCGKIARDAIAKAKEMGK